MAGTITLALSAQVNNGFLQLPLRAQFTAIQTNANGPSPGAITALTTGTEVILSNLSAPGWVMITNLDPTNFVKFGLFIGATFYPLGKVLAGASCIFQFAEDILTANTAAAKFYLKADTASCKVIVAGLDV